jgi:hypothetical protein
MRGKESKGMGRRVKERRGRNDRSGEKRGEGTNRYISSPLSEHHFLCLSGVSLRSNVSRIADFSTRMLSFTLRLFLPSEKVSFVLTG